MNKNIKIILELVIIGLLTTIIRIIGQLLIPSETQEVLKPSIFSINGTMPLAFTIYGLFAYTLIASMFIFLRDNIKGTKIIQGLKYGISCSLIWIVYLLEPLPHVNFIDKFTYPIVDSIALIVMGLLLGIFLGKNNYNKDKFKLNILNVLIITVSFIIGRLILYNVFNIYSSFNSQTLESLIWSLITGLIIGVVICWYDYNINKNYVFKIALLFGLDLLLFNFFMPLVFSTDIIDLILRTIIDIIFVVIGYAINKKLCLNYYYK